MSGKYGKYKGNVTVKQAQDVMIDIAHCLGDLKLHAQNHDMMNACMVPRLKDELGVNPRAIWDFTIQHHLLKKG